VILKEYFHKILSNFRDLFTSELMASLLGFEPGVLALPVRYSTPEVKGLMNL
jgi:hypothetical protein